MKNIGQYNQDLSISRKIDIDSLEARVKTNEDNIAMAESDIEGLNTDVGALKTDVANVKTALSSKQDTVVGAASTIVDDNLTAGKVLVSDDSGKVSTASVGIDDINPDGKYLELTGGYVTGPVGLWGGVTGPLTVEDGAVKLNEGYSIGYGDGNYNFTQISGNFYLSKGGSSQGVYIASSTDGTNGNLRMYVNNDSQNASTHMNIASNGVISLSAEDSSSGSYTVKNVRVTGVADGTNSVDAVNLSQLKQYLPLAGGTMTGPIDMGGQKISNIADGTDTHDAVNLGQLRKTLSLNGGASIPQNADLNSYINVGNYGMSYNEGVATLKNCPTTCAFTLYVLDSHGSATNGLTGAYCYIIQIIIDINQNIYTRAASTGATASDVAFLAWKRIADIDELNSKVQYSTTDLTAGSSSLATGTLYVVYE